MGEYKRNKLRTAGEIYRGIENWPTAFSMRIRQSKAGLRLLNFRNGLNVVCRGGTQDWSVIHEIFFSGSYGSAIKRLQTLPGRPVVLDLGGNIGLFSLLAAQAHPTAEIYSYEPGPPNQRIFEMNQLANPALGKRIHLTPEAVAATSEKVSWTFDEQNPGASSLYGGAGAKFEVQVRSFAEVILSLPEPVALLKIDIEGAEYDLLENTPPEIWRRVQMIALELHDDPRKKLSQEKFRQRMKDYGFIFEDERVVSLFLHR